MVSSCCVSIVWPQTKLKWDMVACYFFFPLPIVSSSKLRRVSSRTPLAAARVKDEDLDSNPGCNLWVVDIRPLPEPSRLWRLSLGSPEELGLLLDTTALFELLPVRESRPLSESIFWEINKQGSRVKTVVIKLSIIKKKLQSFLAHHIFGWWYFIGSVSRAISVQACCTRTIPSAKCLHCTG